MSVRRDRLVTECPVALACKVLEPSWSCCLRRQDGDGDPAIMCHWRMRKVTSHILSFGPCSTLWRLPNAIHAIMMLHFADSTYLLTKNFYSHCNIRHKSPKGMIRSGPFFKDKENSIKTYKEPLDGCLDLSFQFDSPFPLSLLDLASGRLVRRVWDCRIISRRPKNARGCSAQFVLRQS